MNDAFMNPPAAVIILAAGSGTRMRSKHMKVLHSIGGRSMVGHVVTSARGLKPQQIVAVVGHDREAVTEHLQALEPGIVLAVQETQEGTGHALRVGVEALRERSPGLTGTVVVVNGDSPLLRTQTLAQLIHDHQTHGRAVTLMSARLKNPFGYGRLLRSEHGSVTAVVEEKDASPEQRRIDEVNSGVYAFDLTFLAGALPKISNDNVKGEYYLTDVVGLAANDDSVEREGSANAGDRALGVGAWQCADPGETEGANDRVQLAALGKALNRRVLEEWMKAGVTIVDPDTTWVDVDVTLAQDVRILPGVQLLGATSIGEDAVIGPDSTLIDCEVGAEAVVTRTHALLATIGAEASVGPFAYLRPGTTLEAESKVGTFVEIKNSILAVGAKVPHLSYVGDADIGEGTNIGAGTIFANYDGVNKHRTTVGSHAKTGSNNTFIAPVRIGNGAVTGGGSVIRSDVPAGCLAVSAGEQRNLEGWTLRKRPGSAAARAASDTAQ